MAARQAIGESTAAWRARGGGQTTVATRQSSSGVSSAARARVAGLFKEAKALYAPGGEYMKGIEAQLARGSKKAVATGMQSLAAAGLAGTSMTGGLGLQYEEDVAMPARSQATTARLGALSGLLQAEAGATANLATRYSTSPGSYGGGGGGGSATPGFRTTSTPRPSTTRQPEAKKLPTLSAFPSLIGAAKKEPTGYKGIFYGADFYKKPAATTPSASSLMQQADVYNISGRYFS